MCVLVLWVPWEKGLLSTELEACQDVLNRCGQPLAIPGGGPESHPFGG